MKILLWIVGIAVVIGGLWYFWSQPAALGATPQDATYIIEGQAVTLVDGVAQVPAAPDSATMITTRWFGNEAIGDMDGDGISDVAAIITQDAGGSGTFFYAVVAVKKDEGYRGTNGVLLGDRIAPQPTSVEDEIATYNYAERKPGEPMTARPSVAVSKYLELDFKGDLAELEPDDE